MTGIPVIPANENLTKALDHLATGNVNREANAVQKNVVAGHKAVVLHLAPSHRLQFRYPMSMWHLFRMKRHLRR